MVCREVSKSCVVLQNRVGVMKPFCMEISCSVKLRAFYKELQPVRFAYGFSALFIPALERGLHESHRPTSLHGLLQLRRAFRDGLASRLCFHEAAQEQKPSPPRRAGRQPSSPFLQHATDSPRPWGESKRRETLQRQHPATGASLDLLAAS